MSIAPTPLREDWRPTLRCVAASEWGNRVATAKPSLPGAVALGMAADNVTAAATLLAAIPVPMPGVVVEVTLVAPPPSSAAEETREDELPTSPGGELRDPSLPSEPKAPEGSVVGTELGRTAASRANEVVEIPFDDEADIVAKPPVSPRELDISPRELAVVRSEAGPSGGSSKGDLEWPFPEDLLKARFVLRDSRER